VALSAETRNTRALALLRIGVGAFFLIFAQYKIFGTQFTLHGGFQFWINKFLSEGGAYPFMESILRGFVLSHATPIAFLVAYGELAIGLALILGVFVRPASVCGVTFMLTLLFSSDYPGSAAPLWQYFGASLGHSVFALCFMTFLLGDAGATWSLRNRGARTSNVDSDGPGAQSATVVG
jgi:thiosulfate dehydrogenase (quinone) large subunit